MPRKAGIDASGALHHIIVRGIKRRKIFWDDADRDNFLNRIGQVLIETGTNCFAWVLIPNHVHLLLRTGNVPIVTVMRRLLTGYTYSLIGDIGVMAMFFKIATSPFSDRKIHI